LPDEEDEALELLSSLDEEDEALELLSSLDEEDEALELLSSLDEEDETLELLPSEEELSGVSPEDDIPIPKLLLNAMLELLSSPSLLEQEMVNVKANQKTATNAILENMFLIGYLRFVVKIV